MHMGLYIMITETSCNRACRACGGSLHCETLDLGNQALCNRFLPNPTDPEYTHPLALGVCTSCGLLQLLDPPPVEEITPRFPWITYNEPEEHLDHVTDHLLGMIESKENSVAAGVSYKDDTTLERLRERGVGLTWRVTPEELGLSGSKTEIETVQHRFTMEKAAKISKNRGCLDILIVRHILEHTHDLCAFLSELKMLVKPEGLFVFEVPDCTSVLALKDYSTIWEEHVFYFTLLTLQTCLASNGFEIIHMENYPYPLENSIVLLARQRSSGHIPALPEQDREKDLDRVLNYFASFPSERELYRQVLAEYRYRGSKIALLGAGHLACAFVNLLQLREYIECILDDDPNRQGLFMPGSRLPIESSTTLSDPKINLCLLGLNPLNEDRVIAKQRGFVERGGELRSIFPVSERSILK